MKKDAWYARSARLMCVGVLSLTACGGTSGPDELAVDSSAGVSQAATTLDSLNLEILGNITELRAGERLTYNIYQGTLQRCMAASRFSYRPPPFDDLYAGWTNSDLLGRGADGTGWFSPLNTDDAHRGSAAGRQQVVDEPAGNPGFTRLSRDRQGDYLAALGGCEPDASAYEFANIPRSALELSSSLDQEFLSVANSAELRPARRAYAACMSSRGFPGSMPSEVFEGVANAGLADVRRAAVADSKCRERLYHQGMSKLATRLPAWRAAHASDIAKVRKDWLHILRRSRASESTLAPR